MDVKATATIEWKYPGASIHDVGEIQSVALDMSEMVASLATERIDSLPARLLLRWIVRADEQVRGIVYGDPRHLMMRACPHVLFEFPDGGIPGWEALSDGIPLNPIRPEGNLVGRNVFLSGPMTGHEDCNIAGFTKAHLLVRRLGAADVFDQAQEWLSSSEAEANARSHESYMLECLHELTRRDEDGNAYYDAVIQLPGWEASEGARMEESVAKACGIPVIDLSRMLAES